ncbi:MAG: hypothetical protein NPINA01_17180 [Nitrospinaceae bacterium]|nr:MAG: hypothetical protein NPINA01_17180 [Nitrospinaceae bacterium]
MTRNLILSPLLIFVLAAKGIGPISIESLDRHFQSAQSTMEGLLQSESMIKEALKQSDPSEPLTWRLARTYYRLGNVSNEETAKDHFHRCIEQADQAIQLNGQSAWGYFLRGLCRGKLGEMQGIWKSLALIKPLKRDLLAAMQLDPAIDEGGPHRALGKLYLELPVLLGGSVDKSVDHLKQAVALGPEFTDNHLFLAQALYEKGDYRLAKKTLLNLLEITKKSDSLPKVQQTRQKARHLMEKINPWIEAQTLDAQRNQN